MCTVILPQSLAAALEQAVHNTPSPATYATITATAIHNHWKELLPPKRARPPHPQRTPAGALPPNQRHTRKVLYFTITEADAIEQISQQLNNIDISHLVRHALTKHLSGL